MDIFASLPAEERARLRPGPTPEWVEPMKAVLTDDRFSDPDWIYERKLDGIRCLTFKTSDGVRLLSRNQLSLNHRFPEVADAVRRGPAEFVADGEVVAFDGRSDELCEAPAAR